MALASAWSARVSKTRFIVIEVGAGSEKSVLIVSGKRRAVVFTGAEVEV